MEKDGPAPVARTWGSTRLINNVSGSRRQASDSRVKLPLLDNPGVDRRESVALQLPSFRPRGVHLCQEILGGLLHRS